MFDVGFSKFLVIDVVALIAVGPERMPAFARTACHLLGRTQRYVTQVKADIDREVNFKDLEHVQETMSVRVRQWGDTMHSEYEAARNSVAATAVAAQAAVAELRADSVPAATTFREFFGWATVTARLTPSISPGTRPAGFCWFTGWRHS